MRRNGIDIIDPERDPRWDAFVAKHPSGWIYHGSAWKRVLESSFPHMKGFCLVKAGGPGGEIEAGLPLFLVSSVITGTRLVSVPFGTLATPLIDEVSVVPQFLEAALSLAKELGCGRIVIRSMAPVPISQDSPFAETGAFWHHAIALTGDPKDLFKTFDRSCVRQRVTRAQTSGLSVRVGDAESDLRSFFSLYLITRKRVGRPCHPYRFLRAVWEEYHTSGRCQLLLARKGSADIAGLLLLRDKGRLSAEWAASDERFKQFSPNHFLFWEAIQHGFAAGDRIFDFGRTSQFNKGLMDFKNRWGTKATRLYEIVHPRGDGAADEDDERSLLKRVISKACSAAPDRLLEPLGNLIYRHLG
jgi:hypothetical protein